MQANYLSICPIFIYTCCNIESNLGIIISYNHHIDTFIMPHKFKPVYGNSVVLKDSEEPWYDEVDNKPVKKQMYYNNRKNIYTAAFIITCFLIIYKYRKCK